MPYFKGANNLRPIQGNAKDWGGKRRAREGATATAREIKKGGGKEAKKAGRDRSPRKRKGKRERKGSGALTAVLMAFNKRLVCGGGFNLYGSEGPRGKGQREVARIWCPIIADRDEVEGCVAVITWMHAHTVEHDVGVKMCSDGHTNSL